MQHEASDELAGRQRHGLEAAWAFDSIVLVAERDANLVGLDQAAVGDGDAVRVAREVGQNLLWSGEWRFGVDVPVGVIERLEERFERRLAGEFGIRAEELQSVLPMCGFQQRQHLATEHLRQYWNRQQIILCAADPPRSVERYPAAGHDHVDMWVMRHRRPPGVQDRGEADFHT